jgi:tetratricopeptide (TPR) repeat protein
METDRIGVLLAIVVSLLLTQAAFAQPQSDTRQRQAAAEAYDQGTAAYLSGDYEKAAEWFETANRMSPATPALIQAARAHQQAGHLARAATLALRLTLEHAEDPAAVQFGRGLLDRLASQFVRVEVTCDGCTLDVDGALQETLAFFVEAGTSHSVTASFETGERKADVDGQAGETKNLEFQAPPPAAQPSGGDGSGGERGPEGAGGAHPKPLSPVYTIVGASVTGALLISSIISTVDMNSGVSPYQSAVQSYDSCVTKNMPASTCNKLYQTAKDKLDAGQGKETRSTVLWVVTGVAAAATGVIALLLTDWSGKSSGADASEHALRFGASPSSHGINLAMQGRF